MPNPLVLVWLSALVMLFASFSALAALLFQRWTGEMRDRAYRRRRSAIPSALMRHALAAETRPALAASDPQVRKIVLETALEAAHVLRGPARTRLADMLRDLGLDALLRRRGRKARYRARLNAIDTLRLFDDAETLALLRSTENAPDLRIALAALRARIGAGDDVDLSRLLHIAERPGAAKSDALAEIVTARLRTHAHEALEALPQPMPREVRLMLLRAIGEAHIAEALSPLVAALADSDPEIRAAAAGALGALGRGEAGAALAAHVDDRDWRVRLRAADAIGRLGLRAHAHALQPLLQDDIWWVRFRAEQALAKLSPRNGPPSRTPASGAA